MFIDAQKIKLVVDSLVQKKIPFYVIQGRENKKIPVILANKLTIDSLKPLLADTLGFEVMSKAGWPNDHGSFRYGQHIVDTFLAGQRQVGCGSHSKKIHFKKSHC